MGALYLVVSLTRQESLAPIYGFGEFWYPERDLHYHTIPPSNNAVRGLFGSGPYVFSELGSCFRERFLQICGI